MQIDIIAPSSPISFEELDAVRALISNWGFVPHIPADLIEPDLFLANTDEKRFEHLKNALYNEESQAIWCVRGGYGCTRLLPELATLQPPKKQKLLIGCSDITALHIFLQQQWGWSTLHAPGARQAALGKVAEADVLAIKKFLSTWMPACAGMTQEIPYPLEAMNSAAKNTKNIQAPIIGGNLCLIQSSIGTFWQIKPENKILLLEEVNESGYKVDRMLTHLQQAGIFVGITALLLGDFIGGDANVEPVLQRFADTCTFPVLRCRGVGHGTENHPLPLGVQVKEY